VFAQAFFHELREKHDVDDTVFLIDELHLLKGTPVPDTASISNTNVLEIGTASNVLFEIKV